MIPVKEAVKVAMQFLAETFEGETLLQPRLEEIEPSDDGTYWYVTVSFFRGLPPAAFADYVSGTSEGREYKTITVDANNGTVRSVKIRQLT
jgi:hypothetical protein